MYRAWDAVLETLTNPQHRFDDHKYPDTQLYVRFDPEIRVGRAQGRWIVAPVELLDRKRGRLKTAFTAERAPRWR